jgi:regulatory protein
MKKKPRSPPTPQNLANAALHYLQRYAASEASLRRVLKHRIRRAAFDNPLVASDAERIAVLNSAIEMIIETHKKTGALNDASFAETKINSLRRQGRSSRAIQQRLAAKGVSSSLIVAALELNADGAEMEEIDFKAALTLARKRKLGPFRQSAADPSRTRKDFATLARAGFSSSIAKRVLKTETPEDFLDLD